MYLSYLRSLTHPAILTKIIVFLKSLTPFCRFKAPPLLNGFKSFHIQPSVQHTDTLSSSLLSLPVFSPILASQLEVFLPFSLCLIYFSFQLLLESINTLFLSYFLLPLMYVLVCRIFFQLYFTIKFPFLFSHLYPQTS